MRTGSAGQRPSADPAEPRLRNFLSRQAFCCAGPRPPLPAFSRRRSPAGQWDPRPGKTETRFLHPAQQPRAPLPRRYCQGSGLSRHSDNRPRSSAVPVSTGKRSAVLLLQPPGSRPPSRHASSALGTIHPCSQPLFYTGHTGAWWTLQASLGPVLRRWTNHPPWFPPAAWFPYCSLRTEGRHTAAHLVLWSGRSGLPPAGGFPPAVKMKTGIYVPFLLTPHRRATSHKNLLRFPCPPDI